MIKSTKDITTLDVVVSAVPNNLVECVNVYQESELSILYTPRLDYDITINLLK